MKKYDYLIVGSGLFGATSARMLTDSGKKCLVVEARDDVGGNIADEEVEGILVHKYGAHIFHTDNKEVWDFVERFCSFNNFINCPLASYNGKLYHMPFNMNTFYELFGTKTPSEAKAIIGAQIASENIGEPQNLEEKALKMVGRTIYETLVKGYTEKQWGRDAKFLPPFIINRLPLRYVYDNNYFNDRYQGIPSDGYTAMIRRMLDGIEVRTGIDYLDNRAELDALAKKVLFTGRIDKFYDYRFGALEYRSLKFDTQIKNTNDFQGNAVVNYTEYSVPYTRVIEHKHFAVPMKETQTTVVTYEYPKTYEEGDEPFYPVNDEKNNALYAKYKSVADADDKVVFGGRLASYKYFDMDDTIAAAMELVSTL